MALATGLAAAETVQVAQKNRHFLTDAISIHTGDTVEFVNQDEFIHHIYVISKLFNFESEEQPPGTTVPVKFTSAGTFEVRCQIHPKMLLVVTVQ